MAVIQTDISRDPVIGKPGMLARPVFPHFAEVGYSQVDSSERVPRPGDAVIRDNATGVNAFKVPGTATEITQTCGIVLHRDQEIPVVNTSTDMAVQFKDGAPIYVLTFGVIYVSVTTGGSETITWGTRLIWDAPSAITGTSDWEAAPNLPTTFANEAAIRTYLASLPQIDIVAINETPVASNSTNAIIPVKVNMGR